jgi:hypothetical protein
LIRLFTGASKHSRDRKRLEYYNYVWSYDFVTERLENNRRVRLLVVIDEYCPPEKLHLFIEMEFFGGTRSKIHPHPSTQHTDRGFIAGYLKNTKKEITFYYKESYL